MNHEICQRTTIICNSEEELPTLEEITSFERGIEYRIVFGERIRDVREQIGETWKNSLPNFLVGVHTIEGRIGILKLISEEEIIANQDFFEQCAKDYGELAEELIIEFAESKQISINYSFPLDTLNPAEKPQYARNGKMNKWDYSFHGFHCHFINTLTGQEIEAPLIYGAEFGELDPFFFALFIQSSSKYFPLPIKIYDYFHDGQRIIDKMFELGKLETIQSNLKGRTGFVVKDRPQRNKIKVYDEGLLSLKDYSQEKTSFWEKLKAKMKQFN
jgi:hypothetical protein